MIIFIASDFQTGVPKFGSPYIRANTATRLKIKLYRTQIMF
jgi:hypothetical protein